MKRRQAQKKRMPRKTRNEFRRASKRRPHYALDGKARQGCISALTGRTEIDVTIFCPEARQVLGTITLGDKEGERNAALEMMKHDFKQLPSGIITADAGITSSEMTSAVREAGHSYLLAIKGNAGNAYAEALTFDWMDRTDGHQFFEEGHGRQEIRTIRRADVKMFPEGTFSRYADVACIYEVKAQILRVKDDHFTSETRYFIADNEAARLSPIEALTYIRDHWEQESYHWVKDVVLGEDRSAQKTAAGSRMLGVLRQVVYRLGYAACRSVRRFLDIFSADPAKELDAIADRLTKLQC